MTIDDLTLISGSDIDIADGVVVKQPRLRAICSPSVGEAKYRRYVGTFDLLTSDVLGEGGNILPQEIVEHMHIFDLRTSIDEHRKILLEALRFFLCEDVTYDDAAHCCRTASGGVITREVYDDIAFAVLKLSCVQQRRVTAKKFANERAKKIFEKLQKARETHKRSGQGDANFTIANIISKLSAKHPSINLLNIWDLTVYQLYDQFACTCLNNQLDVLGLRWAAWGKEAFDFTQWYHKQS